MPLVRGKYILRSRTSTSVLVATRVSAIYVRLSSSLRCLQSSTICWLTGGDLQTLQPGLASPLRIRLHFWIGNIKPTGFAVSAVPCHRVKRGHGAADTARKGTTWHEWTTRGWFQ